MRRALVALVFILIPTMALAHVGLGDTAGIAHGFIHPLTGVDHILAMVGVGMFAAHLGGRAIWSVPLSFMTMMAVGGITGMIGLPIPFEEIGIGLSIVTLGIVIALEVDLSVCTAMAVVGFFALFHGHAHGSEMPKTASGFSYAVGFLAATGLLHFCGIGFGSAIEAAVQPRFPRSQKIIGGAMTIAGFGVLAGAFS